MIGCASNGQVAPIQVVLLGDLTIVQTNTLTVGGCSCRNHFIRYTFFGGVGMYKMKAKGQACFHGNLWFVSPNSVSLD